MNTATVEERARYVAALRKVARRGGATGAMAALVLRALANGAAVVKVRQGKPNPVRVVRP